MARRGRPPRTDRRTAQRIYIAVTDDELKRIEKELNTDERRVALMRAVESKEYDRDG